MRRRSNLLLLCSALCVALAGCLSAGVEVRPEQMSSFRQGVTTLADVTARLGPASVQTTLDDGSTLLVYTFVTSRPHPESFLPFIGSLVGGADTRSSAAVFVFDANGVLKSASTTTSNVGTGLGSGLEGAPGQNVAPPAVGSAPPPATSVAPAAVNRAAPEPSISVEPLPEESVQPAPEESAEPAAEESARPNPEESTQPAPK